MDEKRVNMSSPERYLTPVTVEDGETAPPPVSLTLLTWHAASSIIPSEMAQIIIFFIYTFIIIL